MRRPDAEGIELDDLALPRPGSDTVRTLWSRAIKRLWIDALSLQPLPEVPQLARLPRALASMTQRAPGPVFSALRRPGVATRIRCLRDPSRSGFDRPGLARGLLCALQHELGPDHDLKLGALDVPRWTWWSERAEVRDGSLHRSDSQGPLFTPLAPGIVLGRADDSPVAMHEAHPDKDGNATSLGGQPLSGWVEALHRALTLLGEFMPAVRAEMDLLLQQVVPVGYDEGRHLSASYRESIGTIYVSLHPHPLTMAEALLHEFSHTKLNVLFELDPVLHNAFTPLYPSPVRPDPRPLHGVLLAAHAFIPVATLYRRLGAAAHSSTQDPGFSTRYRAIVAANEEALQTLEQAQPSAAGLEVLAELRDIGPQGSDAP